MTETGRAAALVAILATLTACSESEPVDMGGDAGVDLGTDIGGDAGACVSTDCVVRVPMNGTCVDYPLTGASCDDGDARTYGDACTDTGACEGVACECSEEACCDGCQWIERSIDCDDENPDTEGDRCRWSDQFSIAYCLGDTICECLTGECCDGCYWLTQGALCDDGNPGTNTDRCEVAGETVYCLGQSL